MNMSAIFTKIIKSWYIWIYLKIKRRLKLNYHKINYYILSFYNICRNLLTLYKYSLSLLLEFNEHILNIQGNILMKKGYTKDIEKLIKVFLKINIWVFG